MERGNALSTPRALACLLYSALWSQLVLWTALASKDQIARGKNNSSGKTLGSLDMVHYEVDLHELEIERIPSLLDRRVVVETRRRESRRIRGDVRQLSSLYEVIPLHEVLAEHFDQDVVGA